MHVYPTVHSADLAFTLVHSAHASYLLRVILTAEYNQHYPGVAAYQHGRAVSIGRYARVLLFQPHALTFEVTFAKD